jgi:hypothetical protein
MRFIHRLVQLAMDTRTVPSPFGAYVYFYSSTIKNIYLYPIFTFDVVSEGSKRVSVLSDLSFLRIPNRSNLARGVKAKAAGCIMY